MATIDDAMGHLKEKDIIKVSYEHPFPFSILGRDSFIAEYVKHDVNNRVLTVLRTTRSNGAYQFEREFRLDYDRIRKLIRLNPEQLF